MSGSQPSNCAVAIKQSSSSKLLTRRATFKGRGFHHRDLLRLELPVAEVFPVNDLEAWRIAIEDVIFERNVQLLAGAN